MKSSMSNDLKITTVFAAFCIGVISTLSNMETERQDVMPFDRLHKCRVAGPCWGCDHEIKRGEYYRNLVIWNEKGPCRTKRLHPECHAIVAAFSQDEWEEFWSGELCGVWDVGKCPICHNPGLMIPAKGGP